MDLLTPRRSPNSVPHYTHISSALPQGPLGCLPSLSLITKGSWIHLLGEGRQASHQLSDTNKIINGWLITWKWNPTIPDLAHLHLTDLRVPCLASCSPTNSYLSHFCIWNTKMSTKTARHKYYWCWKVSSLNTCYRAAYWVSFQCSDSVGWATGRASGL